MTPTELLFWTNQWTAIAREYEEYAKEIDVLFNNWFESSKSPEEISYAIELAAYTVMGSLRAIETLSGAMRKSSSNFQRTPKASSTIFVNPLEALSAIAARMQRPRFNMRTSTFQSTFDKFKRVEEELGSKFTMATDSALRLLQCGLLEIESSLSIRDRASISSSLPKAGHSFFTNKIDTLRERKVSKLDFVDLKRFMEENSLV